MLKFSNEMSIQDSLEKINPVRNREGSQRPSISNGVKLFIESEKGKDVLVIVILVLVGICAFYLGRLSKESTGNALKIESTGQEASALGSYQSNTPKVTLNPTVAEKTQNQGNGNYFASSRGKKYYPNGCSAGKSIKQENRIYFQTSNDAEKAGYTLSSSC
jgi:uncharacterized protein (UPF0333 family)